MTKRILWYFADPMCSWCWGFSPVISALRETCRDRTEVGLMLGGLRPGTTAPVTAEFRAEILHHWRAVHERTGQPFKFEGAMPEGFVYDTEPPSRAVVVVGELDPDRVFPFFRSVQSAFYAEGRDVTRADTLASLAELHGIEPARFLERFRSDEARQRTQLHFQKTREAGIRGFPATVLQDESGYVLLASGCRPLEELRPRLEEWLKKG